MSSDSEANRPRDMADGASNDMRSPGDPEGGGSGVRVGSPFAEGESAVDADHATADITATAEMTGESGFAGDAAWDNSPIRYTAVGALWASAIVTGFAAAAAWSFPEGAFAVATLGCGLAIFAFASGRRFVPATLLVIHLAFFTHSAIEIWR